MALVRNSRGQFCKSSEDSRIQRSRDLVLKLKQKLAAGCETTKVDDELDSRLRDY